MRNLYLAAASAVTLALADDCTGDRCRSITQLSRIFSLIGGFKIFHLTDSATCDAIRPSSVLISNFDNQVDCVRFHIQCHCGYSWREN